MSAFPDSVVDDDGNIHHLLKEPLGGGAQGVIVRTRSPHIAVKLVGSEYSQAQGTLEINSSPPKRQRQDELKNRLEEIRLLPLPELHIAQPLVMLRDQVGSTMQLLKGMEPIRTLISSKRSGLAGFYLNTGGLKRRLQILANAAQILARLHAIPLVYADISENNIMISEQADGTEVWLVDLDNLHYQSSRAEFIHTPDLGAPEVVTGRSGVSTLSDAYSFAILAFWILTQILPFDGDYECDPDSDKNLIELAQRGEIPWIEDTQDNSNYTDNGIPRHLVLSKPLHALFQRTFEEGRLDRTKRPSMAEWSETLRRAADRIISCPSCTSTFDVTAGNCPFCPDSPRPSFIHMQVNRWDPEIDDTGGSAVSSRPVWHKMLDASQDSVVLRHVIEPVLADAEDLPALRIRILRSGIAIEPLSGHEVHAVVGGRIQRVERETKLPMPKAGNEVYLHFGAMDRPHRMAVLRLMEGA